MTPNKELQRTPTALRVLSSLGATRSSGAEHGHSLSAPLLRVEKNDEHN